MTVEETSALRGFGMLRRPRTGNRVFALLGVEEFRRKPESLGKLDQIEELEVPLEILVKGNLMLLFRLLFFSPGSLNPKVSTTHFHETVGISPMTSHSYLNRPTTCVDGGKDNVLMVVVVELGADVVRDRGKESLVVWLVAPRPPDWWNVLAKENEMASAAGPMPGDLGECRLAGDELVNALPLVVLLSRSTI